MPTPTRTPAWADASGNAVVVWHERPDPQVCCGIVMSARFDAGALAWAAPVSLP